MTKLIPKNNNIPEYQLGGFISNLGLSLMNAAQHLFSRSNVAPKVKKNITKSNTSKKSKDPRYNPDIEKLQSQLYRIGAFGDLSKEKAIDGIQGRRTNNAIKYAKSKGYQIKNNTLIKPNENLSLLDRVKNAWRNLNKPSLEEFKEKKRQELRNQAALVNSQVNVPNFVEMKGTPSMKDHDLDLRGKKYNWDDQKIKQEFTKYANETREYLKKHPNLEPLAKKRILETLSYYEKVAKNPKYHDKNGAGFGCIYTASGAYGDQFRYQNNRRLTDAIRRGEDTGFEVVNYDPIRDTGKLKVGDILQLGRNDRTYAHHAEMVTDKIMGYPKLAQTQASGFSPSDKDNDYDNYLKMIQQSRTGWHEGRQNQGMQLLRFVGTKKQNEDWEKEYYKLYG